MSKVSHADKIVICSCLNAVTYPDIPHNWRIINFLHLGLMMKICYGIDTDRGKKWNRITHYADEIVKAREKYGLDGDNWKRYFSNEINSLTDDRKDDLIKLLKFLSNPQDSIIVNT